MRVKMTLEDVLQGKTKGGVVTADESTLMREAVKMMATNNFGALVITSEGRPAGIVTERDALRQAAQGEGFLNKPVSEVMTRDIVVGRFSDDVEVAKRVMTDKRFRHMPIMQKGKLVGIVSIGDVVRSQLMTIEAEATYLRDYIRGEYG
jgi:CBS domain-containing protein